MTELESSLDPLGRIESLLARFKELENRAKQLQRTAPPAKCFVGLCGVEAGLERFDIVEGFGCLKPVTNAPGIIDVCRAADLKHTDYLGVGRYSAGIRAELAFGNTEYPEKRNRQDFLLGIAWHTAALMKLRGHSALFAPAFSNASWDTISAINDNCVEFHMLDDVPRHIAFCKAPSVVTVDDMEWVVSNFMTAFSLRGVDRSRRFGLAFNIAYTWNQTTDLRVALASLWCGLEALFGIQNDRPVTDKLVERIAGWLPSVAKSDVRALYDLRCDAVHGRQIDIAKMNRALVHTDTLLRRVLIRCIETNSVPLPDWT